MFETFFFPARVLKNSPLARETGVFSLVEIRPCGLRYGNSLSPSLAPPLLGGGGLLRCGPPAQEEVEQLGLGGEREFFLKKSEAWYRRPNDLFCLKVETTVCTKVNEMGYCFSNFDFSIPTFYFASL